MMDALAPIDATRVPVVRITDTGEAMADSRDVAAYFGKEHRRVLQTIRELQCSGDFRRHNFVPFKINDLTGESTSHVMMTKDGFTFLVMGFTGGRAAAYKERYIAQFNVMESQLRRQAPAFAIPATYAEALRLAADQSERLAQQEAQIATLVPKGEALDRIATADGSLCVTDAAKTLQVRPNDLFRWLRANGWIYKRPGTNTDIAYQSRLITGVLEHKTKPVPRPDGTEKIATQVRVTPKGLTVLAKLFPGSPMPEVVR